MFKKWIKFTLIGSLILIILAILSPFIFTRPLNVLDFTETGQIGDTIGGIMSPVLAILSSFLTFIAFFAQNEANIIQIENLDVVNRNASYDKYESRLFSLIDLHRKNIDDLEISQSNDDVKVSGQQTFLHLIEWYNGLYGVFKNEEKLTEKEITILSYLYMYYGFSLEENESLRKHYNKYFNNKIELGVGLIQYQNAPYHETYYRYGYGQILSRYYRFMYNIIKYIDQYRFSSNDFKENEIKNIKYESTKLFRSNMTNNEQLLLYYNSLTDLGETWNREGLIKKYRLVKNIIHTQVIGYSPVDWAKRDLKLNNKQIKKFFENNFYIDE